MAGSVKTTAPPKFPCCAREALLRQQHAQTSMSGKSRKTAIHAQFNQWLQSIRHSDILTTSRYINVNSKKLSEAAQRFKHWPLHKAA
ncbi:hypothetical protein N8386_02840 [Planktomarina temperata]|nr:hypothetical protein [Planktomarina temperata]